jgi:hypothetical protein
MTMRSYLLVAGVLGAALVLGACSREGDSGGTSDFSTLRDFADVKATGPDTVEIAVGQPFSVKAEGSAEALKRLEIKVEGGVLKIGRKEGFGNFWGSSGSGATVRVSMPALSGATLTGSGDVSVDKVEGKTLAVEVTGSGNLKVASVKVGALDADLTGSGNIDLAGVADTITLSTTGSGDVDGERLKAGKASISVTGSGNVDLASDGPVDIRIMGSGDVKVKGRAQCKVSAMGSGEADCGA